MFLFMNNSMCMCTQIFCIMNAQMSVYSLCKLIYIFYEEICSKS